MTCNKIYDLHLLPNIMYHFLGWTGCVTLDQVQWCVNTVHLDMNTSENHRKRKLKHLLVSRFFKRKVLLLPAVFLSFVFYWFFYGLYITKQKQKAILGLFWGNNSCQQQWQHMLVLNNSRRTRYEISAFHSLKGNWPITTWCSSCRLIYMCKHLSWQITPDEG